MTGNKRSENKCESLLDFAINRGSRREYLRFAKLCEDSKESYHYGLRYYFLNSEMNLIQYAGSQQVIMVTADGPDSLNQRIQIIKPPSSESEANKEIIRILIFTFAIVNAKFVSAY